MVARASGVRMLSDGAERERAGSLPAAGIVLLEVAAIVAWTGSPAAVRVPELDGVHSRRLAEVLAVALERRNYCWIRAYKATPWVHPPSPRHTPPHRLSCSSGHSCGNGERCSNPPTGIVDTDRESGSNSTCGTRALSDPEILDVDPKFLETEELIPGDVNLGESMESAFLPRVNVVPGGRQSCLPLPLCRMMLVAWRSGDQGRRLRRCGRDAAVPRTGVSLWSVLPPSCCELSESFLPNARCHVLLTSIKGLIRWTYN